MAKRFFDSRKYQDPWFRKLSPINKCFWDYLLSTCSHTGIWKVDFEMVEFCIGCKIDLSVVKQDFEGRIIEISKEKWFIPKFITFQYGKLNPNAPLHNKIIQDLKKDLPKDLFNSITVMSECQQSDTTPKVKDKVEVEVKVKDKDKDVVYEAWNERMPWKINNIDGSRLTHLKERLKEKQFIDEFHTILTKILESDFLSGRKPSKEHPNFRADFDWIIKNNTNYTKVLEGRYDKREVAL